MILKKFFILFSFVLGTTFLSSCSHPSKIVTPPQIVVPPTLSPIEERVYWRELNKSSILETQFANKIMILYFSDEKHCKPCQMMAETTFKDHKVIDLLNNDFIPVRVDGTDHTELFDLLKIKRWPTTVIVLPDGSIVGSVEGYITPDLYVKLLQNLSKILKESLSDSELNAYQK